MAKAGHGLSSDKSWHRLCTKLGLGVESDKGWGQMFSRPLIPDQEGAQSGGGGVLRKGVQPGWGRKGGCSEAASQLTGPHPGPSHDTISF